MPHTRTHSSSKAHSIHSPLSDRINIATRAAHNHLNKLILERLPLTLPPYSHDPSIYVSGLLHIAPIYFTFEELWIKEIRPPCIFNRKTTDESSDCFNALELRPHLETSPAHDVESTSSLHKSISSPRVDLVLRSLFLPDLLRTNRLRADIGDLISITESEMEEKVRSVSSNGSVANFLDHMRNSISNNPHVLLAYAWVFYMALFSGGRHICASLKDASGYGSSFWGQTPYTGLRQCKSENFRGQAMSHPNPQSNCAESKAEFVTENQAFLLETKNSKISPGLQFFGFTGDSNGEDIKIDFKKEFKYAESLLTNNEKMDIILEAQHIFKYMIEIVLYLDELMGSDQDDENSNLMNETKDLMKTRDSICVNKERLMQKPQKPIFKVSWKSIFYGLSAKNRRINVVFPARQITIFKARGARLKRCIPRGFIANIDIPSDIKDNKPAYIHFQFLVLLWLGLTILLSTFLVHKIVSVIKV